MSSGPSTPDASSGPTGPTGPLAPLSKSVKPAPHPIATLDELVNSQAVVTAKETADRVTVSQIVNPDRSSVRNALVAWTGRNFPLNYTILTVSVLPPALCLDGVKRKFEDYVAYLLGSSITDALTKLQPQLPGIKLSYSVSQNKLQVQVSK